MMENEKVAAVCPAVCLQHGCENIYWITLCHDMAQELSAPHSKGRIIVK